MDAKLDMIARLAEQTGSPEVFVEFIDSFLGEQKLGDRERGDFFFEAGAMLHERSLFEYAAVATESALSHYESAGFVPMQVRCHTHLGHVYETLGFFEKSIGSYMKSLSLNTDTSDVAVLMAANLGLGNVYNRLGQPTRAREYVTDTLRMAKASGDSSIESKCYGNLSILMLSEAKYQEAIDFGNRDLSLKRRLSDRSGEAACYVNLSAAHYCVGEYRRSIEYCHKAIEMKREIGDLDGEASCYINLGAAYLKLNDLDKALEFQKRALAIAVQTGYQKRISECHGNIALIHHEAGDYEQSRVQNLETLEIKQRIGDRIGEAICYYGLGFTSVSMGEYDDALLYLEQAMSIKKQLSDRSGLARCLFTLAFIRDQQGLAEESHKLYHEALELARQTGDKETERTALLNLGLTHAKTDFDKAITYIESSLSVTESISEGLINEQHKIGFHSTSTSLNAYEAAIRCCLIHGAQEQAYSYLERSKSNVFVKMLAGVELSPTVDFGDHKSLLDEEAELLLLKQRWSTQDPNQSSAGIGGGEIDAAIERLGRLYENMETIDPEYVSMRRGDSSDCSEIQSLIAAQRDGVCLVEYFFTSDKLLIFILRSDTSELKVEEIDFPEERLNYYLRQYAEEFLYPRADEHHLGQEWQGLSRYLVDPISKHLTGMETICFVPFRQLHYLPLHALRNKGRYLVEQYKVVYSPSASVMRYCHNKRRSLSPDASSLVIGVAKDGDSDLLRQLIESEADRVGDLMGEGSSVYKGDLVTKELIKQELQGQDIVHFSCHGFFDSHMPMNSGLVLADDILTVGDIYQLRLNAQLVTLSACQTGLSEHKPGDELIGLTRSLLYAGAPSVLVSLWSVPADSTLELMKRFYTNLRGGNTKAEALQKAQLEVMQMPRYQHPYHWAPFTLVGDWK